jgi:hypothetical protein
MGVTVKEEAAPDSTVYSATECDVDCQRALALHNEPTRAAHIFPNVLDGLCDQDRAALEAVNDRYMALGKQLRIDCRLGHMTKAEYHTTNDTLGKELVDALRGLLQDMEFRDTQWCLNHKQECFISPRFEPAFQNSLLA